MNEGSLRTVIAALAAKLGGQSKAAEKWGVSPQYLCDVLAARRAPGPKLLRAIGFERLIDYRRAQ